MPTYELLDHSMRQDGRRFIGRAARDGEEAGDVIELEQERGDALEALGSVRPEGCEESDLDLIREVSGDKRLDERDMGEWLADQHSRENLASHRMSKRSQKRNRRAGESKSDDDGSDDDKSGQQARTAPGRAADTATEAVTGNRGGSGGSGRRS